MIIQRLERFRQLMKQHNIDAYIIPTDDFHLSEYTGEYFNSREFMSGFTGSAGTLVVTAKEAGLWTDSRYFLQAAKELSGSTIQLFKQEGAGVPDIGEYLFETLDEGDQVGFDGRVISAHFGGKLKQRLGSKKIVIKHELDLVDRIWEDRPPLPKNKLYGLDLAYTGLSALEKLLRLREDMTVDDVTVHILTSLDDIAWLFNIRGSDVPYNPVVLCYAVIKKDSAILFIDVHKLDYQVKEMLLGLGVAVKDYNDIYNYISTMCSSEVVLLDKNKVNYSICQSLPDGIKVINRMNPTTIFKAVKTKVEINNTRIAHIKDGVAVTKLMYWLKSNIGKIKISEKSACDYLESARRAHENFVELSFPTICGYQEHGAIVHYQVSKESDSSLDAEGLLLVDSGGHYLEGTTDITRTIALGPIDQGIKKQFTAVLKGMLSLSDIRFLYGSTGLNLDILARAPLWELNLDYKHGTGHGVGHLLNVHEGPNNIRWRQTHAQPSIVLEEGMITTNEPGIYIEGSHGIRIENEMLCQTAEENEFGKFMYFETLTFAPIDLDAIEAEDLSELDKKHLNTYHQLVYEKISPYLADDEKAWLKNYTRPL